MLGGFSRGPAVGSGRLRTTDSSCTSAHRFPKPRRQPFHRPRGTLFGFPATPPRSTGHLPRRARCPAPRLTPAAGRGNCHKSSYVQRGERRREPWPRNPAVDRVFDRRGHAFNYALASLELALLLLKMGQPAEVSKLAAEMLPIFRAQKVKREALAALQLFCEAAKRKTATVELAGRLVKFLQRAQHDPELRFEP
jgi:hypothetical protein